MKLSKERLDELIKLYLNDCEDYCNNPGHLFEAQSALVPIRMLIIESKEQEVNLSLLRENIDHNLRPALDDFMLFIKFAGNN